MESEIVYLFDARSGEVLRRATDAEVQGAATDRGGLVWVDGRYCYVDSDVDWGDA